MYIFQKSVKYLKIVAEFVPERQSQFFRTLSDVSSTRPYHPKSLILRPRKMFPANTVINGNTVTYFNGFLYPKSGS